MLVPYERCVQRQAHSIVTAAAAANLGCHWVADSYTNLDYLLALLVRSDNLWSTVGTFKSAAGPSHISLMCHKMRQLPNSIVSVLPVSPVKTSCSFQLRIQLFVTPLVCTPAGCSSQQRAPARAAERRHCLLLCYPPVCGAQLSPVLRAAQATQLCKM